MRKGKVFLLAAGLLCGAALITGCSAGGSVGNTDDTVYVKEITQTLDTGDQITCLVFQGGKGGMSCDWLSVHGYDNGGSN